MVKSNKIAHIELLTIQNPCELFEVEDFLQMKKRLYCDLLCGIFSDYYLWVLLLLKLPRLKLEALM